MKKTVSFYDFERAMRSENFSYDGLEALYEFLCDMEEDTGQELELDPVGLRCEFSEYKTLEEFQDDYGDEYQSIEDIENNTMVIPIDDESFIVQNF